MVIAGIILLGIVAVAASALAGKYKQMYYDELEEVAILAEELDAANMVLAEVRVQYDDQRQIIVERNLKIQSLAKFLQEGVFYDVENDTIVLAENLEKIGEL